MNPSHSLLRSLLVLLLFYASSSAPITGRGPCAGSGHIPFCNTSLPIRDRARELVALLTLDEKIPQLSNTAAGIPRLSIPPYQWWSESLHGVASNGPGVSFSAPIAAATLFPQVILSASAFNRSLWRALAGAAAVEARAMHNSALAGLTFWAPNINVFRDPRWGRGQETPGEDPLLSAAYAAEFVAAFQGDDPIMLSACCKHYTAYDLDKWGQYSRYTFDARVTAQDMEDTFQPPFRSCIQEGRASCLMCSYNQVDGVPACARGDLLRKAREEWGFNGYVTSDCDAVAIIYENQNYTRSPEDAVAIVLKSGMDINCGTYLLRHTKAAVQSGKLREDDIDRALVNLLSVQLRLGLFDDNSEDKWFEKLGPRDVCTAEHRMIALEAARQGIVLLKNNNSTLPLRKDNVGTLALVGPAACDAYALGGDYTGVPCNPKSLLEGIQAYVPGVRFASGCLDVPCNSTVGFKEAINIVIDADIVIVVAGLNLTEETEDLDRISLLLPGKQMDLVTAIADTSKCPLVLILVGGGPLDVSFANEDPRIASILWIGYPGESGAQAVGEVLFGDFNPVGRLPVTWYPESFTNVPMNDMNMRPDASRGFPGRTYRFYIGEVVYEFGYGLSYSEYSYTMFSAPERIKLTQEPIDVCIDRSQPDITNYGLGYIPIDALSSCNAINFSVHIQVANMGSMDGSHSILLFWTHKASIKDSLRKQLIAFEQVHTVAGEATNVRFQIEPCKHLSTVNEQGTRVIPLGSHLLMVGDLEHHLYVDP